MNKLILTLGAGGTGKSYQINQFKNVIKISPTNLSAKIISGKTIYNLTNSPLTNLQSKNIKFTQTVVIDEVFLFNKKEMSVILECLNNQDLYMFGDQYQMNTIDKTYFYDAFNIQDLQRIQIIKLDKYYRQTDTQLINIINQYRLTKLSNQNDFKQLTLEEAIQKVIKEQYTILTGTHKRCETIQKKINKYAYNNTFFGSDGIKYRINQTVCMVSQNGAIQERDKIISFYYKSIKNQQFCIINLEKNGEQIPSHLSECKYKFISGDILTVNISQGQTLNQGVILDCQYFFSFGSYYTSITRATEYDKIYIMTKHKDEFQADLNNIFI